MAVVTLLPVGLTRVSVLAVPLVGSGLNGLFRVAVLTVPALGVTLLAVAPGAAGGCVAAGIPGARGAFLAPVTSARLEGLTLPGALGVSIDRVPLLRVGLALVPLLLVRAVVVAL